MTIKVRITGGLGNQLFKFFHGIQLANLYKQELILDKTWYVDPVDRRKLVSSREFDLNSYPEINAFRTLEWNSSRLHRISGQVLRRLPRKMQVPIGYMTEENRSVFLENCQTPNTVDGSFESLDCLPDKADILKYLQRSNRSDWLEQSLLQVSRENPIALHVRRGDFLNIPTMYDVVSSSYYSQALSAAFDIGGRRPVHLFSDHPEEAQLFLGQGIQIDRVVLQDPGVSTVDIFELLSNYSVIIGANSTFSWWAGYLSFLRGGSIFCSMPDRFLGDGYSDPSKKLRHAGATVLSSR